MGSLIYATNTSLDGYTEDPSGAFDWSVPSEDVHLMYNDLVRGIGLQLMGRRMYETMAVWETDPSFTEGSPILSDFAAAWQDSDKVVFSTTLTEPLTERTRIVDRFDPDEVRALKDASTTDVLIGGPGLAAQALRSGLVDEVRVVVSPVTVGAGKPAFPVDLRLDLTLVEQRPFDNGTVLVVYRTSS